MLGGRRFKFDIEAAIFLTVLHRLMDPGSDRAAEKWRLDYSLPLHLVSESFKQCHYGKRQHLG
jgi:hypothetical protein